MFFWFSFLIVMKVIIFISIIQRYAYVIIIFALLYTHYMLFYFPGKLGNLGNLGNSAGVISNESVMNQ